MGVPIAEVGEPVAPKPHGPLRITAYLPEEIRSIRYVRNHHFIELTDAEGNTIRLVAKSMIKGACRACRGEVYVESRIGEMRCPHCFDMVDWVWGQAQLSFVPEHESRFSSIPPPADNAQKDHP